MHLTFTVEEVDEMFEHHSIVAVLAVQLKKIEKETCKYVKRTELTTKESLQKDLSDSLCLQNLKLKKQRQKSQEELHE